MEIRVELTGLVRAVAKEKWVQMSLPEGATFRDVTRVLVEKYPDLAGVVIDPEGNDLLNANIFSRNGEDVIMGEQMDESPRDGDRLLLLSIIVGGSS
jgi:molybdopterin converting factor small subunit